MTDDPSIFKVSRQVDHDVKSHVMGMGDKTIDYPLNGLDEITYSFNMPDGSEFGLKMFGNGEFQLFGWDKEGNSHELMLVRPGDRLPFDLKMCS